jgi:hypothetical protein
MIFTLKMASPSHPWQGRVAGFPCHDTDPLRGKLISKSKGWNLVTHHCHGLRSTVRGWFSWDFPMDWWHLQSFSWLFFHENRRVFSMGKPVSIF